MIWIIRFQLMGVLCNHKIKNNAAGSVQAVVLADSATLNNATLTATARPAGTQSYSTPTVLEITTPFSAGLLPLADHVIAVWRTFTKPVKIAAGIVTP